MRTAQLPLRRLLSHRVARCRPCGRRLRVSCSSGTTPEVISSTGNPLVKHCVRLRESAKYRQECGTLLLVGSTLIEEAAGGQPLNAVMMFTRPQRSTKQLPWAHSAVAAERTVPVSDQALKRITGLETVDKVDVVVEVQLPAFHDLAARGAARHVRVLALEGVQDPGNLGALLRTAAAFGWDAVHLLPGCCDPFNDKALRASRGAAFKLPLSRGPWSQLLKVTRAHRLKLLAAQPDAFSEDAPAEGASVQQLVRQPGYMRLMQQRAEAPEGVCLVLGSEGQGLSDEALQHCTPLGIPMVPTAMESLNVGTAGGILMFLLSGPAPTLLQRLPELRPRSTPSSSSSSRSSSTALSENGSFRPSSRTAGSNRQDGVVGESRGYDRGLSNRGPAARPQHGARE